MILLVRQDVSRGQKSVEYFQNERILLKLAMIEAQQHYQGQLLQQILNAINKSDESCEIPEGVSLPLQNIAELTDFQ